ncbi:hypothetical protein B0T16DRAFT_402809 [Cercophora newfieldiana]|uniref:Protein kinase domain-containing protein n=1 Tax=Cercophora newfieldiana TaxID=92897 RepID=A0AA39YSU3_9PEZI|nr:hypothetical protein B0T16DRAFT_402809 [Cercophora newfieldiana]
MKADLAWPTVDLYPDEFSTIAEEKANHDLVAGAQHVIRRVILKPPPGESWTGDSRPDDGDDNTKWHLDWHDGVLFIEFMKRGRLDNYIRAAGIRGTPFPTQVLWQLFDCLFRGVVGLAYPRQFRYPGARPAEQNVHLQRETSREKPVLEPYSTKETIIHLDIDTLNVLVGDFDDSNHNLVPLVKIADLGAATCQSIKSFRDMDNTWRMRQYGKTEVWTPEQFSQQWEYHSFHPACAGLSTGGNYSWWTNLYQIGLIMFSLITLCEHPIPAVLDYYWLVDPAGNRRKAWSVGVYVMQDKFSHIDLGLRGLVMRCLAYKPADRPTMKELEDILDIYVNTRAGPANKEDQDAQEWAKNIFAGPPPPRAWKGRYGDLKDGRASSIWPESARWMRLPQGMHHIRIAALENLGV